MIAVTCMSSVPVLVIVNVCAAVRRPDQLGAERERGCAIIGESAAAVAPKRATDADDQGQREPHERAKHGACYPGRAAVRTRRATDEPRRAC